MSKWMLSPIQEDLLDSKGWPVNNQLARQAKTRVCRDRLFLPLANANQTSLEKAACPFFFALAREAQAASLCNKDREVMWNRNFRMIPVALSVAESACFGLSFQGDGHVTL